MNTQLTCLVNTLALRCLISAVSNRQTLYSVSVIINSILLSVFALSDWFEEDAAWQAVQEANWKCL